ncbi:MAG: hypothetical protein GWO02_13765 [Gammaproteobacteria bacterium]|nr:hypothetical protein [Gammaproteobacteria bacterium]
MLVSYGGRLTEPGVRSLLERFIEVCLLRAGPQDLPASRALLGLALIAYVAVLTAIGLVDLGWHNAVARTAVDLALTAGLLHLALHVRRVPARFVQSLSAIAGTGALLGAVLWPLAAWVTSAERGDAAAALASLATLAVLIWSLVVLGHILRHALSLSFAGGMLASVIYFATGVGVMRWLFATG